MKKGKTVWILIFSGLLLMLSIIVLGKALVLECSRQNGEYSMQKVLVSVKNQIDRQGANSFSLDDIERLRKDLPEEDISYIARSGLMNIQVSNGGREIPVKLTGADCNYLMFSGLTFAQGGFITNAHQEEGAMVAIIDEELAWDMFKTIPATGRTLDIYGSVFRIIGVVKKDDTLLGRLTDDGLPDVYIPATVMLELDDTARITALQIKTAGAGKPDENIENISSALRQIGKSEENYNIIDFNLKYMLMEQQPLLFVFFLGTASILVILVHIKNLVKRLYSLIRDGCRTDYFTNVIKDNISGIVSCLLETALAFLGIVLIWLGIKFKPYIPPRYIPDELTNVAYYLDLIKAVIQRGVQNMGYVPPRPELIVNAAGMLLGLCFCLSAVPGLLLLYTGFREAMVQNMGADRLALRFGLLFVLSLAILAVTAYFAGLPFMPDLKGVLVAWTFLFLNTLNIKRKESDVGNV